MPNDHQLLNHELQLISNPKTYNHTEHVARIENLFVRLSGIYGGKWIKQYNNDKYLASAKNEWLNALKDFSDKAVSRSVDYCLSEKKTPPTLPEFINFCHRSPAPYHSNYKNIELAKPCDPEIALKYLEQIKKNLAINTKDLQQNTLNLNQAAEFLGLNAETTRRRAVNSLIPGAKVGKTWMFLEVDLVTYMRSLYPSNASQGVSHRRTDIWHSTSEMVPGGLTSPTAENEYVEALEVK